MIGQSFGLKIVIRILPQHIIKLLYQAADGDIVSPSELAATLTMGIAQNPDDVGLFCPDRIVVSGSERDLSPFLKHKRQFLPTFYLLLFRNQLNLKTNGGVISSIRVSIIQFWRLWLGLTALIQRVLNGSPIRSQGRKAPIEDRILSRFYLFTYSELKELPISPNELIRCMKSLPYL